MSDPLFHKSSHSGHSADCVEVATLSRDTLVRDSRHPERGHLTFSVTEWNAFLAAARNAGV
ncbi:DUF397 domain-containing protein [Marinitenerispora sediminis]|uniref:DUF397 domain-containing protein n=1 Tax=Marinitenerispora sediminis TaxID=1931232 RepID=A0A368TAT9_9ACTN|nr:DUF397 domain-containing protein [Marinitenerispora sediminis]RCV47492.1 DUF397 domain-containing protein [Marinitenerispora sediminis]RCV47768.1 DUF397 domain-containing protein [Marinitenerispora sediminis]RCV62138.1 DUF397 domain-containing protein [Marinitenerispora sediminis]